MLRILGPQGRGGEAWWAGLVGFPHRPGPFMEIPKRNFVLYAILACVVGSVVVPLLAQDDEIRWLDNYSEAIREAKRTGKPIFLEFRCEP